MIIFDEYGQPDYEAMILEKEEAWEISGDCDGACEQCVVSVYCPYAYTEESEET